MKTLIDAYALALVLFMLGCDAGQKAENSVASLQGGRVAEKGAFPATVSLMVWAQADGDFKHTCTATRVAPKAFLTAAHCVFDEETSHIREAFQNGAEIRLLYGIYLDPTDYDVQSGAATYESITTQAKVDGDPLLHESYPPAAKEFTAGGPPFEKAVDLAIIVVKDADADFLQHVSIAKIDTNTRQVGDAVVYGGYGIEWDWGVPRRLKYGQGALQTIEGLMLIVPGSYQGDPNPSIAPGDSGGALFLGSDPTNLTVVGVNSKTLFNSYMIRLDDAGPLPVGTWLTERLSELAP